jgi:hypothetical protein
VLLGVIAALLCLIGLQLPEASRPSNPIGPLCQGLRRLLALVRGLVQVVADLPAGAAVAGLRCGLSLRRAGLWLATGTVAALVASGALALRPSVMSQAGVGNGPGSDLSSSGDDAPSRSAFGAARFGAAALSASSRRAAPVFKVGVSGDGTPALPRSHPTPRCPPRPPLDAATISSPGGGPPIERTRTVRVGEPLVDEEGRLVHAHGGGMLVPKQAGADHDRYFWYTPSHCATQLRVARRWRVRLTALRGARGGRGGGEDGCKEDAQRN